MRFSTTSARAAGAPLARLWAALGAALLHLPFYAVSLYEGAFWPPLLALGDVALAGLVWGYGFRRSGGVLP